MSSRLLVYAKLSGHDMDDAFYSRQFYKETLLGIKHGQRALPDEQKPWVTLQCELSNPLDTSQDTNPVHQYLACNPLRLPATRDLSLSDLFDRSKVMPVDGGDLATVSALRAFIAASTPREPLGDADTLVLWGHGTGKRVLSGSGRPHQLPLSLAMPGETADFDLPRERAVPPSGLGPEDLRLALDGHRTGLLVLQSCRSASLEFAEMLTGVARYMLVSPQTVYAVDWRYDTWLADGAIWSRATSPKKRGEHLVSVVRALRRPDASIALLELPWVTLVAHRLDRLMPLLRTQLAARPYFAKTLAEVAQSAHAYEDDSPDELAVDLYDYAERLSQHPHAPDFIRELAIKLMNAVDAAVAAHCIVGGSARPASLRGLTLALSRQDYFPLREPNRTSHYVPPSIDEWLRRTMRTGAASREERPPFVPL